MNDVLKFLQDAQVFFVSTVDGDKPKVRPFSFVMEYNGKLCFGTNNQKPTYRQLTANPNIEICATSKDLKWLRLSGQAVFCTTKEAKIKALDAMPMHVENIRPQAQQGAQTFRCSIWYIMQLQV